MGLRPVAGKLALWQRFAIARRRRCPRVRIAAASRSHNGPFAGELLRLGRLHCSALHAHTGAAVPIAIARAGGHQSF